MELNGHVRVRWVRIFEQVSRMPTASVVLGLVLVGALAFVPNLDRGPFYHLVEGDQALVVQHIHRGEWMFPKPNGDTLPSKPLLFNWLGGIASVLAGEVSEGTVRLPSALTSVAGLAVAFVAGRRLIGPQAALLGAIFLLTTPVYAKQARDATTDALLSFCLLSAFALFYAMYDRRESAGWRRTAFFVAVAGAILTKGPVGLALPLLACGTFLVWKRDAEPAWRLVSGADIWLVVVLPLLWYGPAWLVWGQAFLDKQLFDENLRRFAGGFGLPQGLHVLVGPSLTDAAPWSLLASIALVRLFTSRSWSDGNRFLTCWWLTTLAFFSLSVGKRTVYLLPLYPAVALLAGEEAWRLATAEREEFEPSRVRTMEWVGLAAACFAAVVLTGMARRVGPRVNPPPDPAFEIAYFYHFLVHGHPLMTALIVAGALVTWLAAIQRLRAGAWSELPLLFAVALVPLYVFVFPVVRDEHKQIRSVKEFGLAVARAVPSDKPLYFYRYGSKELPGYLYFYVGRDVAAAPCNRFSLECPATYYLMWQRDWHPDDPSLQGRAELLLRSDDSAVFPRYAPFVLVRLRGADEDA